MGSASRSSISERFIKEFGDYIQKSEILQPGTKLTVSSISVEYDDMEEEVRTFIHLKADNNLIYMLKETSNWFSPELSDEEEIRETFKDIIIDDLDEKIKRVFRIT